MGLPLFVTPDESGEAAKATDKTAARSRSSIRRQRLRRNPNHHGLQMTDFFGAGPRREATELDTPLEREMAYRRLREGMGLNRGNSMGWSTSPARRDVAQSSLGPNATALPPVPESRDFQGNRRSGLYARRGRSGRPWADRQGDQYHQLMEPSSGITRRETSADLANPRSGAQLPALTPNFSPARRYAVEGSGGHHRGNGLPNYSSYSAHPYADEEWMRPTNRASSPSRDTRSLLDLPPLRRMDFRAVTEIASQRRAAHLDGLGDRDRSLSPDGDGAWETMLTTLTPDPQLPSAGSSFASGSGATSNSSNAETSSTSLTTIGSSTSNPNGAMDAVVDNACDPAEDSRESSEMSNTDGEDEEEDIYELEDTLLSRGRYWYDDVPPTAEAVRRREMEIDSLAEEVVRREVGMDSLAGWQRVVSRLARRGDIPDEWWAQVGFTRSIPHEAVRS